MLRHNCKLFDIKWPSLFRYLGIYLGYNRQINETKNWDEKIQDIESTLKKWEKRDLTLFGRVQVLKTFALSKLVLPATNLNLPKNIVKKVNKIFYRFLWRSTFYRFLWRSTEKVKRVKVNQEIEHGGLRIAGIQAFFDSLLANWVNRILDAERNVHGWVQLPRLFLKPFDIDGLDVRYKFDDSVNFPRVESLPSYYKRMIKSFNKAFVTDELEFIGNIWNQPLWGNKYVTVHVIGKKNVLFFRNWIRSGIRKVSHVLFMNGVRNENHINQKLVYKQNMYAEIMTMKDALRPYHLNHIIVLQVSLLKQKLLQKD